MCGYERPVARTVGACRYERVRAVQATGALALGQTAAVTLVRSDPPLTPLMTSDTAPLGTASSTALYGSGSYPAYLAFDGLNGAINSSVLSASYPAWWQFQFPSPQKVTAYALWARSDGAMDEMPRSFKLWGSPDGTNWTQVSAVNNATNWQVGQKRVVLVDTPDWYTHYKLTVTSNNGSVDAVSIGELLLYGPPTAVPRLTSNTTPAGTASSSDSSANAYKAFDGDYHSGSVASQSAASFPAWWQYQFTAPVEIKSFALWAPFEDRGTEMPQEFSLQGSTDGSPGPRCRTRSRPRRIGTPASAGTTRWRSRVRMPTTGCRSRPTMATAAIAPSANCR